MPQKFTIPKEDDTQFIIPEDDEQVNEEPPKLNLQPKEGSIARVWRAANTPIIDVSPQTRQMMEEYKKAHPIAGTIGNFGVDAMLSASSPLGLGLEATTGGSALALKYGSPGLARALLAPHIAVSGATATHGLYRTGKGLYEGNYPEAAVGAIETGLGGLGLRGGLRIKGNLNGLDAETVQKPTSFAGRRTRQGAAPELSPLVEPEPSAPTIKPIESEVPTSEVKPAKIRRPKGKRANQPAKLLMKSREEIASQEPTIEPPKSDVHQQIVDEYKATHEPTIEPKVEPTTEELPPLSWKSETGAVGRNIKQKRIVKDVTFEKGDTDQDYNVKFSDGTIQPIWYSKATREWHLLEDGEPNLDISSPTKEGLASKLAPVSSVPPEAQAPKEQLTIEPLKAEEPETPLLRSKGYVPQESTLPKPKNYYDKREMRTGRFISTKGYPTNEFERGELEPPVQPTHQDFIQNMKDILAQRAKKLGGEETGALTFGGPPKPQNKQLRDAVEEWGYGRNVNRIIPTKAGQTANNAIRDQKLLNVLAANNIKVGKRGVYSPTVWADIARHDAQAGKMIANYFSESPDILRKTADVTGVTRNLALAQGIPTRSGTLSAHGFNLLGSDVMARGLTKGITDFAKTTYDPAIDVAYIQKTKPYLKEAIEAGLDWKGDTYSIGKIDEALRKIPIIGKARDLQAKLLEDPLFKVKAPAMQLKIYMEKLHELAPKLGRKEAAKAAAEFANDFSGYVNKTFKDKSTWDSAQILALAPSWLRSRANIAAKGILPKGYGGKAGYGVPVARGAAIGAGIAATGMATSGVDKYLDSKAAEVTGIPAGQATFTGSRGEEKKQRNIEPLGTAIEPTRSVMQNITQIGQGRIGYPFEYAMNKASQPMQTITNLGRNIDPYENPLWGKDKYGHPIPAPKAALNIIREIGRPITPGVIAALMDYYQGKAPLEEVFTRAAGAPISYTSIPRGKKASTRLPRLK